MRRRGITPEALRTFAEMIGVAKNNSMVDIGKLEFALRQDLEGRAPRGMAVLQPLRVVITNWPADQVEELELAWWPGEPGRAGIRKIPFGRELFIEREDFSENPPPGWKRLAPGREVRLMGAYVIRCDEFSKSKAGEVTELRCSYLPSTRSGDPGAERKVSGTLHWVPAEASPEAQVRLYDRLFSVEQPDAEEDFVQHLNPKSLVTMNEARVEPALARAEPGSRYQFVRQGYFFVDPVDSSSGAPVFNQIIGLKDTWGKAADKPEEPRPEKKRKDSKPSLTQPDQRGRESGPRLREAAEQASFERYRAQLGISIAEAEMLARDRRLGVFFDKALGANPNAKSVAKWLLNELLALTKELERLPFDAPVFGRMVALVDEGKITPAAGKRLLAELVARGGDPERLVKELGLEKVDDGLVIGSAVTKVLQSQAAEVARYRAGEKKLFGVLLGAVMRETKGAADAGAVRKALTEKLG
jgi:glutaminyl-tRNA synthetase